MQRNRFQGHQNVTAGKSSWRISETSSLARICVKGYSSMCCSSLLASLIRYSEVLTSLAAVWTKGESDLHVAQPLAMLRKFWRIESWGTEISTC